jgi:uncharacterized damage-inducible protein DinB
MTESILKDAFAHHVWASLQLLEACDALSGEQLATDTPGTYGSIRDTLRHLVGSDCSYLKVTSGGNHEPVDEESLDLAGLRAEMAKHADAWAGVIGNDPDPDRWLVRHRPDGSETHAPLGIRLAQAPHHGTDHRSQVCTALTNIGIEPPQIDVWDYGMAHERTRRTAPA